MVHFTSAFYSERLIISPPLVDSRIDEGATMSLVEEIQKAHHINVVLLTPSSYVARPWSKPGVLEVPGSELSTVIDRLNKTAPNTAVFANRYDGIDLPENACRVLVMHGLPREWSLLKLSEASSRQGSPILDRQIAQKIEQGIGRGVRSRSDHCVVFFMGKELISFMSQVQNQIYFTGETKNKSKSGNTLLRC